MLRRSKCETCGVVFYVYDRREDQCDNCKHGEAEKTTAKKAADTPKKEDTEAKKSSNKNNKKSKEV